MKNVFYTAGLLTELSDIEQSYLKGGWDLQLDILLDWSEIN